MPEWDQRAYQEGEIILILRDKMRRPKAERLNEGILRKVGIEMKHR